MSYELFVGLRYMRSRRKDRSISVITWISVCGVALGVVALIVTTSVLNGFRDNLRKAIIGSLPHVTVFGFVEEEIEIQNLEQEIQAHPEVRYTSPYIFQQALLAAEARPKGALIRGIDPAREINVTEVGLFLREEVYPTDPPSIEAQQKISQRLLSRLSYAESQKNRQMAGIILGAALAQSLGVYPGDTVKLISTQERMTPIGEIPRVKKLEVIGIFESGISGYDEVLAFMDYRLLQKIYKMGDRVTGIGVRIDDAETAAEVAEEVQEQLPSYAVNNWASDNKAIFFVMKLEKIAIFVLLLLIVAVAAFNIISSLIMMVLEKSKEIAILKSIGASDRSIRKIFMIQGSLVGTIGTGCGVIIGLAICWLIMTVDIIEIPPGVYPGGNRIPIAIHWGEIALTGICSFLICFLITIYPASKAARVQPAESLRYE